MIAAIMQPTYLPWMGYFALIDRVDRFVLLDDVQFAKRSWQQRNWIKTPMGRMWLTVPVRVKDRFGQSITDVRISDPSFCIKHGRALQHNYSRAPHFEPHFRAISTALQELASSCRLVDLNIGLIRFFMDLLGIETPVVRSSSLAVDGVRSALLASICKAIGADTYMSATGSAAYMQEELHEFLDRDVEVVFHSYEHPTYAQLFPPFVAQASIVDLVFNEGPDARRVMQSGNRPPRDLQAMRDVAVAS